MPLKTFLFGMAFTYFETGIAVLLCHGNHQKMVIQIEVWFNRKSTIIIYLWLIDSKSSPTFCMFHLPFWKEIFLLAIYKRKKNCTEPTQKGAFIEVEKVFFSSAVKELKKYFQRKPALSYDGCGFAQFLFNALNESFAFSFLTTHTFNTYSNAHFSLSL